MWLPLSFDQILATKRITAWVWDCSNQCLCLFASLSVYQYLWFCKNSMPKSPWWQQNSAIKFSCHLLVILFKWSGTNFQIIAANLCLWWKPSAMTAVLKEGFDYNSASTIATLHLDLDVLLILTLCNACSMHLPWKDPNCIHHTQYLCGDGLWQFVR